MEKKSKHKHIGRKWIPKTNGSIFLLEHKPKIYRLFNSFFRSFEFTHWKNLYLQIEKRTNFSARVCICVCGCVCMCAKYWKEIKNEYTHSNIYYHKTIECDLFFTAHSIRIQKELMQITSTIAHSHNTFTHTLWTHIHSRMKSQYLYFSI